MKRISKFILFFLVLLPVQLAFAAVENYKLDPSHSFVLWHINHLGFSTQVGKWPAEGTITIDTDKLQNSKVDVTIQIKQIITGLAELDKHLMAESFFDAEKFPTATFVSDKVTLTSKKTAKVRGMLTLHGVTKPITLNVTLNKMGANPVTNKASVGFSATAELKRSDFGMTTLVPTLGDTVTLNIDAEGVKVS